jgi:GNAT superfamily N-acetyltransferase
MSLRSALFEMVFGKAAKKTPTLRHALSERMQFPDFGASTANGSTASQRVPLRDLEHLEPIGGARPWDLGGEDISEEGVQAALSRGDTHGPFTAGANWTGRDHEARIASLLRDGWEDPIRVYKDGDGIGIDDGYHRLAAASIRGDQDIAVEYVERGSRPSLRGALADRKRPDAGGVQGGRDLLAGLTDSDPLAKHVRMKAADVVDIIRRYRSGLRTTERERRALREIIDYSRGREDINNSVIQRVLRSNAFRDEYVGADRAFDVIRDEAPLADRAVAGEELDNLRQIGTSDDSIRYGWGADESASGPRHEINISREGDIGLTEGGVDFEAGQSLADARQFFRHVFAAVRDDAARNARPQYFLGTDEPLGSARRVRRGQFYKRLLQQAEQRGDLPSGYRLDLSDQEPRLVRTAPDGSSAQAGSFTFDRYEDFSGDGPAIVARDANGKIVGYLNHDVNEAGQPYVADVMVDPSLRRQGIARALYAEAERQLGALTPSSMITENGLAFWRGFRPESVAGRNADLPSSYTTKKLARQQWNAARRAFEDETPLPRPASELPNTGSASAIGLGALPAGALTLREALAERYGA